MFFQSEPLLILFPQDFKMGEGNVRKIGTYEKKWPRY